MTSQRIRAALSVFFTVAGVVVMVYVVHYIAVTQPRDAAQERCNTQTIATLKSWLLIRQKRDAAMDTRDHAVVTVLNELVAGRQPSPAEIMAWSDAVARDQQVRDEADLASPPLPNC